MSEFWGYDYKSGWFEDTNFIDEYLKHTEHGDITTVIKELGYINGYSIYQIEDSLLGNPIQVYELQKDVTLPKYLIEFCPTGGDISYFVARNIPSLIELLNKLTPLVHAAFVCGYVDDINRDKFQ
jgi:hypothetical protein